MKEYTDKQKNTFVELAQKVGIGRARKELGYPSWPTGQDWCKARGVTPNVDTLMAEVKKFHTFYETTDALVITEEALARIRETVTGLDDLSADDLKKVTEALQKAVNTWLVLQGKATTITETQKKDGVDLEILDLLNMERARNVASRDLEAGSEA